jgi:hypothetical protein
MQLTVLLLLLSTVSFAQSLGSARDAKTKVKAPKEATQVVQQFNVSNTNGIQGIQKANAISASNPGITKPAKQEFGIYIQGMYPPVDQGGDVIASAVAIGALPYTDNGTTCGYANDYDAECPYVGSTSPDVVYSFTPAANMSISVDLCGTAYDSKTYVFENNTSTLIACNDDFYYDATCGYYTSYIENVPLTVGNVYYIIIDGYGGACGDYILAVDEFIPLPAPPNDDCATAEYVPGPYPYTTTGTTLGATIDCPGVLDWNAVWYEVNLPYALNNLVVDFCNSNAGAATVGIIYYFDCSDCNAYVLADSYNWTDCADASPTLYFNSIAGPGTIMFPAYLSPAQDFTITFNVTEAQPCVVTCPGGAIQENEPDILDDQLDVINGGCNSTPNVFSPISVGDTYCGHSNTYLYLGSQYRDTDWYELDLSGSSTGWDLTWSVEAEFQVLIFLLDANQGGCSNIISLASNSAAECTPISVTATVNPGIYWCWVGPSVFTGYPAGGDWQYTATLTGNPVGLTYCVAGATYCDEYIDNVNLNTINNASGCGLVNGYSDYTAITTTLQPSIPYTLTVHNPTPYTGDVVDCWIDFDQNYTFDNTTEYFSTTSSDMMTFTGTVTVPPSALNGNTRMRVRIYYYPTAADPCGTSTYGEVEDYTVNLQIVQYPNDVGVQSIDAPVGMGNLAPVTPLATVRNYGTAQQSFPVNMTIGSYTSTKTVNNLAPGATQQVTFDTWTPPGAGSYTVTACTQLSGDAQPANDCKTGSCAFMEDRQVYGYNAYDPSGTLVEGPVTFQLVSPGTLNLLAPTTSGDFIACGTWVAGDRWIGCQYGGGYYEIDETNGAMTFLAASGAGGMTGLSYCWDDDLMYAVYYNGTNMDWYSVNPTTLAETFIANMGGSHLFINLAYNDITDMFYAIDIVDDALYSINKATGAPTLVGPTNLSMNYAQDMEVDNNNGIMYAAAYTSTGQLCLIDQVSGGGTVIGNFQGGAEICGFAIPYAPVTGITLDIDLWLEGPYNPALDGGMNTWLNPAYMPLAQPYGPTLPFYNNPNPCWYYTGTEAVGAIPAGIVDWVMVELRDGGTTGAYTIAKQALFINTTGKIVALDGTSLPLFTVTPTGPLYVVVYHRNHQAVMSSAGMIVSGTTYSWNFKTGSGQYYGGINGGKQLETGVWGARSGDGNADKQTNNDDKLVVWKPESGTAGYKGGDYNCDGQINNSDKIDRWKPNSGTASQVPN